MEISKNKKRRLKIELPLWPSTCTSGYILKKHPLNQKDTCTPLFIAALFTIAKIWTQMKCSSTNEWIKMWCVCIYIYIYIHTHTQTHVLYTHSEILFRYKIEQNFAICNVDGLEGYYAKWSQSDKDEYYMI